MRHALEIPRQLRGTGAVITSDNGQYSTLLPPISRGHGNGPLGAYDSKEDKENKNPTPFTNEKKRNIISIVGTSNLCIIQTTKDIVKKIQDTKATKRIQTTVTV